MVVPFLCNEVNASAEIIWRRKIPKPRKGPEFVPFCSSAAVPCLGLQQELSHQDGQLGDSSDICTQKGTKTFQERDRERWKLKQHHAQANEGGCKACDTQKLVILVSCLKKITQTLLLHQHSSFL